MIYILGHIGPFDYKIRFTQHLRFHLGQRNLITFSLLLQSKNNAR